MKDKVITIVGLARSGLGAANLLSELGARVTVTDIKSEEELKDYVCRLNPSVRVVAGKHPEDIFLEADMLVVSPGIKLTIPPIVNAGAKGIQIISEIELAYQIIKDFERILIQGKKESYKPIEFLAVTGTNGKSTTTALLNFILRKSKFNTILGGNIGNALTEEIYKEIKRIDSRRNGNFIKRRIDYIVTEVSSFQLETIQDFRPYIATILNITPDHLDRYLTIEEYRLSKKRIFDNQTRKDFIVLNRDDPETMKLYKMYLCLKDISVPKVFFFSRKEKVEGIYCKDEVIYINLPNLSYTYDPIPLINEKEIRIKGVHNLENAMAASVMALLASCPIEVVRKSLTEFPGLEHRLEFVREISGVNYFNDSKGTNIGAVVKSLESFQEPVILIAGGRDKRGDFSVLRPLIKDKVKTLILIGEAQNKIKEALGDITKAIIAQDLREAVEIAHTIAVTGDIVLLSPACASFDMFDDFEDRGRQFKKYVKELNNG